MLASWHNISMDITEVAKLGGKARQSGLSPQEKSELARKAANARWGNTVKKPSNASKLAEPELKYNKCSICGTRYPNHITSNWDRYHKGLGDWHEFED
jgi:hypothetical protein